MTDDRPFTLGLTIPPWPPIGCVHRGLDLAEQLGLHVCSTWDHLVEFTTPSVEGAGGDSAHDPFEYQALLGALATRAVNVRLAVGVTELLRRHPVVVAQSFVTLAHLARQRPILGIGAGERINTERFGLPFEAPVERLAEGLEILRVCLESDVPFAFTGRSFQLRDAALPLRSPHGRAPEVWVGGRGPRMLELAGRFGDGWYPADIVDPDHYSEGLASVRTAARAYGRDPNAVLPAAELTVFAERDRSEAFAALGSDDARLTGLLLDGAAWRAAGLEHPFGHDHRGFVDHDPARVSRDMLTAVPPEVVARHALTGVPKDIAEQVFALRAAGLRHINLSFGPIDNAVAASTVTDVVASIRRRLGGVA
jgi:phthiodiolone/phenolphthiodiolone dimycocerosates ketoreductase